MIPTNKIILTTKLKHLSQSIRPISDIDDWIFNNDTKLYLSAVLIPLVIRNNSHTIILTKRAQHLNHHAGQISFPGGRAEVNDKNAIDTALRETHEEIGIPLDKIKIVGFLDQYTTVSNFVITPVVGYVDSSYQTQLNKFEVEKVFEVSCEVLLNNNNYQRNEILWQGKKHFFWEINHQGHHIWGATAAILKNFAERLL